MTNFTHADTHEATLHKDGNNFASTSQFWRDATKKQQELFAQGKKSKLYFHRFGKFSIHQYERRY